MKKPLAATLLVLGLGGLVLLLSRQSDETAPAVDLRTDAQKRADAEVLNAKANRALRFDQAAAKLQNDPLDRSQLSDTALLLDDPKIGSLPAMEAIYSLLTSLRTTANRGDYPAGLNVEVTNALLGDNPLKVGILPMDSPRIDENGELIDEYDTPFWFHSLSSAEITITSAGPDRLLHTDDDIVYPAEF